MKKWVLALVAGLVGASAQAGVVDPVSAEVLSRLNTVFSRMEYVGFTPSGLPCRVTVARQAGLGGRPLSQLWINGLDPMPGVSGPFMVWRSSGFFQAGIYAPEFSTRIAVDTPDTLEVISSVVSPTLPGGVVMKSWSGKLTLKADASGRLTSAALTEEGDDPATGMHLSRSFACGAH